MENVFHKAFSGIYPRTYDICGKQTKKEKGIGALGKKKIACLLVTAIICPFYI